MIGRDVGGPLGAVLGRSQSLCRWSWVPLKVTGSLSTPLWVVLRRSRGLCGWSWVTLKASVGGPWAALGPESGPGPGGNAIRASGLGRRAASEPPPVCNFFARELESANEAIVGTVVL